jgi:hypothetical protein
MLTDSYPEPDMYGEAMPESAKYSKMEPIPVPGKAFSPENEMPNLAGKVALVTGAK